MDEEVIAWKLRPFLQEGKPFLIGGGTPLGFHLGPVFYYLSSIPLFFSRLDPIGWGVAAALFGATTILLMWLTGKNLYGRRVGLAAGLFWATSFTAVMGDRHWWPLVLDPALALAVILALYNIGKVRILPGRRMRTFYWWMVLGLTLAFGWQADLTVLPLFLAAGTVAILNFRRQWKGILIAVGILAISVLPLVLFEIRHPGVNLGKLFAYEFLKRSDPAGAGSDLIIKPLAETIAFIPQSLSRLVFPITNLDGNLLNFYTWCQETADARFAGQPGWAVGVTVLVLLTPFFSQKFAKRHGLTEVSQTSGSAGDKIVRLVIISGIAGILIFKLFGGNLYDFYLAILYPVTMLLAAKSIDFIWRKWGIVAAGVITTAIVGLNITAIYRSYHPQSLAIKQEAVAWTVEKMRGKEFELDSLSRCGRYNGARYLFFLEDKEPVKSFVDNDLSWLYPSYDRRPEPEYLATFATPNDLTEQDRKRYEDLVDMAEATEDFGDLEVLITKK